MMERAEINSLVIHYLTTEDDMHFGVTSFMNFLKTQEPDGDSD
jgi:hypothetical protein